MKIHGCGTGSPAPSADRKFDNSLITPLRPLAAIATLTPNPAIGKSATVDRVIPDNKLRCNNPLRKPGGGTNVVRARIDRGWCEVVVLSTGASGDLLAQRQPSISK